MTTAMQVTKLDGVKDIMPLAARLNFAKALVAEEEAGKTTPEAEKLLDNAVSAIKDAEANPAPTK